MSATRPHKDRCCICGNTRPDYTLHSFPLLKYKDIYDKWIEVIGRKDLAELPVNVVRRKYHVCEAHFGKNDYYVTKQVRKLKKNSIPTIDCKKVDSPCTPRKDRVPDAKIYTPGSVTYFAKSLEQKLLAEFYGKKKEMEEALTNTKVKEENPCFIKMEKTEHTPYMNSTEEMPEAPCIIEKEEMEDTQYFINAVQMEEVQHIKEEMDECEYITDDDLGTTWANSKDAVKIEVIPDILEYR